MAISRQPDLQGTHTELEVLKERVAGLEGGRFAPLEAKVDAARAEWQSFRGEWGTKLELVRAEGRATREILLEQARRVDRLDVRIDRLEGAVNESRRWLVGGMVGLAALITILRFVFP